MSQHDEHGPGDIDREEYGPEWWAMGREFCKCEHHYDEHSPEDGHCYECTDCRQFLALDNQ